MKKRMYVALGILWNVPEGLTVHSSSVSPLVVGVNSEEMIRRRIE